ncbi:alpha/beta fold hydrolase [Dactylosporangium sp. NPDC000555]|uniref:alpha/beta hydrolase family protein n=1 Tax=Dactylosporangium sp. NPDC000555 TaxID=3154260 RepID=UPI003317C2C1
MTFQYFPDEPMYSQGVLLALNTGADVNEVDRACRSFAERGDTPAGVAWYESWSAVANLVAGQASVDERAGRLFTAAHKHRRACIYYILAERYLDATDERKQVAYRSVLDEFAAFVACSGEPVEFVEVPYAGTSLPCLFIPAGGPGPSPTVINIDGFDMFKEILYLRRGDQARLRGLSMLVVDTPGVGEALRLRGMPARFDTEVPIAACVDYLETRADVDPDRIGLLGNSLGGYYAPRAASFEKRLKCCAAWGAAFNAGPRVRQMYGSDAVLSAPASQLLWVTGQETLEEALRVMDDFNLAPVLSQLNVPLLVLHGENDHLVPWENAEQTVAAATGSPRVDLVRGTAELGGAGHVSMDNFESGADIIFDWLAEILSGRLSNDSGAHERTRSSTGR